MARVVIVGGLNLDQSIWSLYQGFKHIKVSVDHVPIHTISAGQLAYLPGIKDKIVTALEGAKLLIWWQAKNWADLGFVADLRKRFPKLATACWSLDDPYIIDKYDPPANKVFEWGLTCCPGSFEWYRENGVKPIVAYTPCDRNRHGKAVPNPKETCDIGFSATNVYPRAQFPHILADRKRIVMSIWDLGKVNLYGIWDQGAFSWGGEWGLSEKYKKASRGYRSATDIAGCYAAARINLNSTVRPDGYQYINRRVIEGMACGGFFLSDRIVGVEQMLAEDEEIVLWSNLDELRAKAKWYLAHEDVRKKIAAAGRARALTIFDNGTMAARILRTIGID